MADIWHGYVAVERYPDNLSEDNWITLIEAIRSIETVGDAAPHILQEQGNHDVFELVIDDDNSVWYSNIYIWEARYAAGAIEFENFRVELVDLFGVADNKVTYTVGTTTIRDRPSVFARFKYNGKNRIRVGLFGCPDDSNLCTWDESRLECEGYKTNNDVMWEKVE